MRSCDGGRGRLLYDEEYTQETFSGGKMACKLFRHSPVGVCVFFLTYHSPPPHLPLSSSEQQRVFQPPTVPFTLNLAALSSVPNAFSLFQFFAQQQQQQQQQRQQQQQQQQQLQSPQTQAKPAPSVDFTNIQSMSESSRPSAKRIPSATENVSLFQAVVFHGVYTECKLYVCTYVCFVQRVQSMQVDGESPSVGVSSSMLQALERPKPTGSPIPVTSPMHVGNLISPRRYVQMHIRIPQVWKIL